MTVKVELREFKFEDRRVEHLLGVFDDFVRSIRDYNGHFNFESSEHEACMLSTYRDSAFGILFSLFQLGHITSSDFHMRMKSLYAVYFNRVG